MAYWSFFVLTSLQILGELLHFQGYIIPSQLITFKVYCLFCEVYLYLYYIYYSLFWTGSHTIQSLNNLLYLFTNSILGRVIIIVVSFNALLLTTCFKVDLLHSLIFVDYLKIFLQSITIHLVLHWSKTLRINGHFSILFVPIFFSVMCILVLCVCVCVYNCTIIFSRTTHHFILGSFFYILRIKRPFLPWLLLLSILLLL